MTVRLIVEFTAQDGKEADVADLVVDYAAKVRAEPGAVSFEVYRKSNHPEHFYMIEAFADKQAHLDHLAAQHCQVFDSVLPPLINEPEVTRTFIDDVAPAPVG